MVQGGQGLSEYLRAEREYHDAAVAGLDDLHRRIFTEMLARTPLAEEGPESWAAGSLFRDVTPEGAQLGQFQRRGVAANAWAVVIDLEAEAAAVGSTYAECGVREVSPDAALVAWSLDTQGDELYTLRFRDLTSGIDLSDRIERTHYSGAWAADARTFFYTTVDHVHRSHQVWRHRVGDDPSADALVWQEDDRRFDLSVRASRCGRWVLLHAFSRDSAETWAIPADAPDTAPVSVGGRREGHEYHVESVVGGPAPFLAVTNHGGAREFTLSWVGFGQVDPSEWLPAAPGPMPGDPDHPDRLPAPAGGLETPGGAGEPGGPDTVDASDVPARPDTPDVPNVPDRPDTPDVPNVPDRPDTPDVPNVPDRPDTPDVPNVPDRPEAALTAPPRRLLDVDAFAGHVVVSLREAGRPALYLVPVRAEGLGWAAARAIRAPEAGTIALGTNERFDASFVTVVTQSSVAPTRWSDVPFDADLEPSTRHRTEAPNHDQTAYVATRRWVVVRDGTHVPVTLVAHRVTPLDGSAPCLLYGYGAYEHALEPRFSRSLPSLLDRGVVYAIAHVRGGGELGRRWWDEGHLAAKANSFRDFVDVARALGSGPQAIVDGSRIVARGGSAGGLLVAAAMDLDPEVFAGVIAEVPFVDVVNSMLDSELPLTVGEWEEWGNPALPEQYEWLEGYAPYENVPPASRRPFILATGAVNDPRVLVHEPAKWVARLRATDPEQGAVESPGSRGGVLLRVALDEGSHSGAAGRYAALEEEAQTQAVILATMGITA
jgi:oligopeptidase B